GFDDVSGLGTPNGLLLARALTGIAQSQMYFGSEPDVIDANGQGGWTSGANQSLLFQTMSGSATQVGIVAGAQTLSFASPASASFAWTSQLAQQALQADFDPRLVTMFDKQAQGTVTQGQVAAGQSLAVSFNGAAGQALQADLSSAFGFADFSSRGSA